MVLTQGKASYQQSRAKTFEIGSKDSYVQFVAEKSGNCCETCRQYDGQRFRENDPDKPKLPLHPNCRCHYEPVKQDSNDNNEHIIYEIAQYTIEETLGPTTGPFIDAAKIAGEIAANFNHWVWIAKSLARLVQQKDQTFDYTEAYLQINECNSNKDTKGLARLISIMYKRYRQLQKK